MTATQLKPGYFFARPHREKRVYHVYHEDDESETLCGIEREASWKLLLAGYPVCEDCLDVYDELTELEAQE